MESIRRFIEIIFHLSLAFVRFYCIRNHTPKFSSSRQLNFVISGVVLWCLATWAGHWWSGMASLTCLEPPLSLLGCPSPHGLLSPRCVTLVNGFPAVKRAIPKVHALFKTLFVSHLLISHWPKQLAKSGFRGWRNRLHFLMGGRFCFLFFHSVPLPFQILLTKIWWSWTESWDQRHLRAVTLSVLTKVLVKLHGESFPIFFSSSFNYYFFMYLHIFFFNQDHWANSG